MHRRPICPSAFIGRRNKDRRNPMNHSKRFPSASIFVFTVAFLWLGFALAGRADTQIIAWGYNSDGQTNVPPGITNAVAMSGGDFYSLVLLSNGTAVAWGDNSVNQTNVPPGLNNLVAVAAG